MWMRVVYLKMDQSQIDEARADAKKIGEIVSKVKGCRFIYPLVESVDTPGEAISVTAWDTRADAEAYAKDLYPQLVKGFVKRTAAPPLLKEYEMHADVE